MATYLELVNVVADSSLFNRVRFAIFVAAEKISEDGHRHLFPSRNPRHLWARDVFSHLEEHLIPMMWAIIAQNREKSVADLLDSTDEEIQSYVDRAVDYFAF